MTAERNAVVDPRSAAEHNAKDNIECVLVNATTAKMKCHLE